MITLIILSGYFVGVPALLPEQILHDLRPPIVSDPNYPIKSIQPTTPITTFRVSTVSKSIADYRGTFRSVYVTTVCPADVACSKVTMQLAYLIVYSVESGGQFRLLSNTGLDWKSILEGSQVIVSGILVKPSQWQASSWTPSYSFDGDIIVQAITVG